MLFIIPGIGLLRLASLLYHPLTRIHHPPEDWGSSKLSRYTYRPPLKFDFHAYNLEHSLIEPDMSPLPLPFPPSKPAPFNVPFMGPSLETSPLPLNALERAFKQARKSSQPKLPTCPLNDAPVHSIVDVCASTNTTMLAIDDAPAVCQLAPIVDAARQRDSTVVLWTHLALVILLATIGAAAYKLFRFVARQLVAHQASVEHSQSEIFVSGGPALLKPRPMSRRQLLVQLVTLLTAVGSMARSTVECFTLEVILFLIPLAEYTFTVTDYLVSSRILSCSSVFAETVLFPIIGFAFLVVLRTIVVLGAWLYSELDKPLSICHEYHDTHSTSIAFDISHDEKKNHSYNNIQNPVVGHLLIEWPVTVEMVSMSGLGEGEVMPGATGDAVVEVANTDVVFEDVVEGGAQLTVAIDEDWVIVETVPQTLEVIVSPVVEKVKKEEQPATDVVVEEKKEEQATTGVVVEKVDKKEQVTTGVVVEEPVINQTPVAPRLNAAAAEFVMRPIPTQPRAFTMTSIAPSTPTQPRAFYQSRPQGASALAPVTGILNHGARRALQFRERFEQGSMAGSGVNERVAGPSGSGVRAQSQQSTRPYIPAARAESLTYFTPRGPSAIPIQPPPPKEETARTLRRRLRYEARVARRAAEAAEAASAAAPTSN